MLEKEIEMRMKFHAEDKNGMLLKLSVAGENGIPDRLLLMPNSQFAFVELKQKGKKPSKLQKYYHKRLRQKGYDVHVVDDVHLAKKVVDSYAGD